MEDFSLMKQHLQEKEELISTLRAELRQTQEEQDAQLEELKTLQQQYLLRNREVIELLPLKAQLQEYQEQAETMQMMQEELRRESLAWQQELHQLRMEKNTWKLQEKRIKEQYTMAIKDKDKQLSHLQSLLWSSSQSQILSAQYQRQLLEEKNTLSIQLSDVSQSPHKSQHHSSDLSKHCAVLERQVQEL
ncbi:golgin subfamily B member 1-like [Microtus oregoni]|uniref:golgin subfamily B member 1-like n=1 Tax=Microtus oregoni TaxID=111838 RepID=UPI001BB23CC5|nr:golgin subfamily B member 1-like [Microtus oregoni]